MKQSTLFIIDADGFKTINDTLGHLFGDSVLTEMSREIRKHFRHTDILGRIGGDEFVIIWQHVEERDFHQACCQIRRQIASQNLNIALGYHWVAEAIQGLPPVLQAADKHMYEEKRRYHRRQVIRP